MKFKAWCTRHSVALTPFDGPPYCVKPDDPQPGVWEIDLSDMACPEEGEDPANECAADWRLEVVDVLP